MEIYLGVEHQGVGRSNTFKSCGAFMRKASRDYIVSTWLPFAPTVVSQVRQDSHIRKSTMTLKARRNSQAVDD